ncbi:MAG: HD domain-containing phosphohydrolase [Chloroflexia bacterium]
MGIPLRVLILEDREADAELLALELSRAGFAPEWTRVESEEAYVEELEKGYDLILADYRLPQFDGMRALQLMRERGLDIPFILVSGTIGEELAVEAMKQGAYDYLLKDRLARLGTAASRALEEKQLREARRQAEAALREAEARYRTLFEGIPVGLYRCTPDGRILEVNAALAQMLGFPDRESMLEQCRDARDLYLRPQERERWKTWIERSGLIRQYVTQWRRVDGSVIWVRESARAVRDGTGRTLYYDGAVEDITALVLAEEERQRALERLRRVVEGTVRALAATAEHRDPYTAGHQRRVARLAAAIAREMGLSPEQIEGIEVAGIVHDIGKSTVPTEILSKPGRLSPEEMALVRLHPRASFEILRTIEFPWPVALVALQHHERLDGSGYPQGLGGEQILLEARILAVADVVEAMSSHRPYRPALGLDRALEEVRQGRGVLFDARAVDACMRVFATDFRLDEPA